MERSPIMPDALIAKQMQHAAPTAAVPMSGVEKALHAVRSHLGMDIAFVSEFVGDRHLIRNVDIAPAGRVVMRVGDSSPLHEGYCRRVVDGRLPELIPDTADLPEAMAIPATRAIPIGAHLSVPLKLEDGHVYGTFCCFSFQADVSLNERDLRMMRAVAEVVAHQIDADLRNTRVRIEKRERIEAALRADVPDIVYQPVYELRTGRLVGAEALSRFTLDPLRSPDKWFSEAGEVGLKTQLERQAARRALQAFQPLWPRPGLHLGLNSSPQTVVDGRLVELLDGLPADRVILEITEHDHVEDYGELLRALAPLRRRGVKIAIDDTGSGYASMRHVLNLQPDFIKLDISLTQGIDADRVKRALAKALIEFGQETGCKLVAEGVESVREIETLRGLGVHAAQGYELGRPMPAAALAHLPPERSTDPSGHAEQGPPRAARPRR